jgi:hypothetical protein
MPQRGKGREGAVFKEERSNIPIGQNTFFDQICSVERRQLSVYGPWNGHQIVVDACWIRFASQRGVLHGHMAFSAAQSSAVYRLVVPPAAFFHFVAMSGDSLSMWLRNVVTCQISFSLSAPFHAASH